jgi:hypothetical protein
MGSGRTCSCAIAPPIPYFDGCQRNVIAEVAIDVATTAYLDYEWHMAAHDRDRALAGLVTERQVSDALRTAVREQNRAVDVLAEAPCR